MSDYPIRATLEFAFAEQSKWFTEKDEVAKAVDPILASDLATVFTHAGTEDREKRTPNREAIRAVFACGKAGRFAALDADELENATSKLALRIDDQSLKVSLLVGGDAMRARKGTLLQALVAVSNEVIGAFRRRGGLSRGVIAPEGSFRYPHVRPPPEAQWVDMSSLVDYIDLAFHNGQQRYGQKYPEMASALATASPPPGVIKREDDRIVTMQWIDSLADDEAVMRAASLHEQWVSKLVKTRPWGGYNELGDRKESINNSGPRPPFTFIDGNSKFAYKAIIVGADGEVDEEVWDEVLSARRDDLRGLRLIVPVRDAALQILARAKKAGIDAVLYPDEQDQYWNPDPPGLWVGPIRPGPSDT